MTRSATPITLKSPKTKRFLVCFIGCTLAIVGISGLLGRVQLTAKCGAGSLCQLGCQHPMLQKAYLDRVSQIGTPHSPKSCCAQANNEKLRLETKQRAARKAAERGDPIRPRWFTAVKGATPGLQQAYRYHGGYFEAREQGEWPNVRDIFGPGIVGSSGESLPNSPKKA